MSLALHDSFKTLVFNDSQNTTCLQETLFKNILITLRINFPAHQCIPSLQLPPALSGGIEYDNRI